MNFGDKFSLANENIVIGQEVKEGSGVPAELIVTTKVTNMCSPQIICENIRDENFLVNVLAFENNKLKNITSSFPGDDQGWRVSLKPPNIGGIQYEVSQEDNGVYPGFVSLSTAFSENCHGIIEQGEIRRCIINNEARANNMPAGINVSTIIENSCEPQSMCADIRDEDFMMKISTFEYNTFRQKIKPFPGDSSGWIVYFDPDQFSGNQMPPYGTGIQYKVQQTVQDKSKFNGILMNTTLSDECRSTISKGSLKNCTCHKFLIRTSGVGLKQV